MGNPWPPSDFRAAAAASPITMAVFAFELEDFSAAHPEGSAPTETSYLIQSIEEPKQQFLLSGRFTLIDTAGSDMGEAKGGVQEMRGCEAVIAMRLRSRPSLDRHCDQNKHDGIHCAVADQRCQEWLSPIFRLTCARARPIHGPVASAGYCRSACQRQSKPPKQARRRIWPEFTHADASATYR